MNVSETVQHCGCTYAGIDVPTATHNAASVRLDVVTVQGSKCEHCSEEFCVNRPLHRN